MAKQQIRQHKMFVPYGTYLRQVGISFMLETLGARVLKKRIKAKGCCINRSGRDVLYNKPRGKDR